MKPFIFTSERTTTVFGVGLWSVTKSHAYIQTECKNEIHLGKLVQMVPRHLGSLRAASTQAKIPGFGEVHTQITVFINSESNPLQI